MTQDQTSGASEMSGDQSTGPVHHKSGKPVVRRAKDHTFAMIKKTFMELVKKTNAVPSMREVGEACGMSLGTVQRHLKNFDWKLHYEDYFKAQTPDILVALMQAAKRGNPAAIKLWFEIVEGWRPVNVQEFVPAASGLVKPTLIIQMPANPNEPDASAAAQ